MTRRYRCSSSRYHQGFPSHAVAIAAEFLVARSAASQEICPASVDRDLISPRLTCFGYTTICSRARAELPSVILRSRYHACHAKLRLDDKKDKAQSLRAHVHSNLYTGRSNHRLSNFRFAQIYGISQCAIYPSFLWRY